MRRLIAALVAASAAALVVAATAVPATAGTISPAGSTTAASIGRLTFSLSGLLPVQCELQLQLAFTSTYVLPTSDIGSVTGGAFSNCSQPTVTATLLGPSYPIRLVAVLGLLLPTGALATLQGFSARFRIGSLVDCLFRGDLPFLLANGSGGLALLTNALPLASGACPAGTTLSVAGPIALSTPQTFS